MLPTFVKVDNGSKQLRNSPSQFLRYIFLHTVNTQLFAIRGTRDLVDIKKGQMIDPPLLSPSFGPSKLFEIINYPLLA